SDVCSSDLFGVLAVAGSEKAHEIVGQVIARVKFELFAEFRANLGCRLPFIDREARERQEIMRVRSLGVERNGAFELARGGGHVVGVAISAAKEDMERGVVARELNHLAKDGGSAVLVGGIFCGKKRDAERVVSLDVRCELHGAGKGLRCLGI